MIGLGTRLSVKGKTGREKLCAYVAILLILFGFLPAVDYIY